MMILRYSPPEILALRSLVTVESELIKVAAELAVLGEVDISRELVTLSFAETQNLTASYRASYRGLNHVWRLTGEWPKQIDEDQKGEDVLASMREIYLSKWSSGLEDALKGQNVHDPQAILDLVEQNDTGYALYGKSKNLVKALELSLKYNSGDKLNALQLNDQTQIKSEDVDATSRDLIIRIGKHWQDKYLLGTLVEAENLWPYYLHGLLRSVLDINAKELKARGEAIFSAFAQRLREGRPSSALSSKSIHDLLTIANENTIRGPGTVHWSAAGDEPPETLFKSPSTASDIASLEDGLGTTLPDDYKTFLQTSNGFIGNDLGDGIFNGYFPDPGLFPAEKVAWVKESYFELPLSMLEIPFEIENLIPPKPEEESKRGPDGKLLWDTPLPLLGRVLNLGARDIDNLWLVEPEFVKRARDVYHEMYERAVDDRQRQKLERAIRDFAGSRQKFDELGWCCIKWSAGGAANMTVYAGFRNYLEDVVERSGRAQWS